MKMKKQTFSIPVAKLRNPTVEQMKKMKAGVHAKTEKAMRVEAKVALKKGFP